ncbi:hypothetical protein CMV_008529 [Castanea mollissima]|uniref:Uncharacterized protein n=1 Tax=Castanea mollissima TaxID=60419 RepID=A0A8J4RJL7_9ROSI|nr:hypothetical protein CMV_008529 [Castanea mollissima]
MLLTLDPRVRNVIAHVVEAFAACPHLHVDHHTPFSRTQCSIRAQLTCATVTRSRSSSHANQTNLPDLFLSFFHKNPKVLRSS